MPTPANYDIFLIKGVREANPEPKGSPAGRGDGLWGQPPRWGIACGTRAFGRPPKWQESTVVRERFLGRAGLVFRY